MSFADTNTHREKRVRVMQVARLRDSRGERQVRIDDVSSRGLQATSEHPPARGEFVTISVGRRDLAGHVKWVKGRAFGLVLQERIDPVALGAGDVRPITRGGAAKTRGGRVAPVSTKAFALQWAMLLVAALSAAFLLTRMLGLGS